MTYIRKGDDHLEDELRNQGLRKKKKMLCKVYIVSPSSTFVYNGQNQ